ncbi:CDP-glucose 4,6-dehydratase [Fulvivirga sp. 29W222]|uniref:CDP-glucose 4,6-dehydratase n=1 Tax=Fulvivirga marina TaxID=2494733 RepID=A0A937G174_9BACT|nr:CDP-glucose 4,6-dehydratase [Fulvivirga marina]MBL6448110.1 CDP-glucose 4,6-dehydratase [Fulvivirga marina]
MQSAFDNIYKNKKVLVTGNTGFKGSWLTLWLSMLGAEVYGYSLQPPTEPSLYKVLDLSKLINQEEADIRDFNRLKKIIKTIKPDIIFHLAAQSLVGESYLTPLDTIEINTMGSANVMEAVRQLKYPVAIVMVTSDKCYENKEWLHGYRETDPMGGYDPYSSSKGAAEILISSWRNSFFPNNTILNHGVRLASARAGNVIGGGDWAKDRIVPDCIRDLLKGRVIGVRNPHATRPWQHVLEPLHGYLHLGSKLLNFQSKTVVDYCEAFNFGPQVSSNKSVKHLVEKVIQYWGEGSWEWTSPQAAHHEASLLNLSTDKAFHQLKWMAKWDFDTTVQHTVEWYVYWRNGSSELLDLTEQQIKAYETAVHNAARAVKQEEIKSI